MCINCEVTRVGCSIKKKHVENMINKVLENETKSIEVKGESEDMA